VIAATEIRLFDDTDVPWIGRVLDLVVAHLGKPWRVLLERIEHADIAAQPQRIAAVVRAIRRGITGRAARAKVARQVRGIVLGHPALSVEDRISRLATAAEQLGMPPVEVESLLWADLALEQPVVLPNGRPFERELVAQANLDRIQGAVRRARSLQIHAWDPANALVRTVARYGLVAHASRGADGETILDVTGPLALFHTTTVYGNALAQLMPLLAEQDRFTLDVVTEQDGIERTLHVEPPLTLPLVRPRGRPPNVAERLTTDLAKVCAVEREPAPLAAGDDLVFPDLALSPSRDPDEMVDQRDRCYVEIVGFSTAGYLAHKLARYRAAGVERVMLCVDEGRVVGSLADLAEPRIVGFQKRVDHVELLAKIREVT
jgi:predicted nuclease of restriction endonuclease-like RecB superfamily